MALPAHLIFRIPTQNIFDVLFVEDTTDTDSLSSDSESPNDKTCENKASKETAETTRRYSRDELKSIGADLKARGRATISGDDKRLIASLIQLNKDEKVSQVSKKTFSKPKNRGYHDHRSYNAWKKWRMENTNWRAKY